MPTNITNILYDITKHTPNKVALIHNNKKTTYIKLENDVLKAVSKLRSKGIGYGDKVLVFIPMSKDLYVTLLALWHIGAAAVFLDAWAVKNSLNYAAELTNCKAFIGIPKAFALLFSSRTLRRLPIKIMAYDSYYKNANQASKSSVAEVLDSDTALITFTTGSTGLPKAANRTHQFLISQHKVIAEHLKPKNNDVDLVTLPIFVLTNLASGITSLIPEMNHRKPECFDEAEMLNFIKEYNVTTMAGSPIIFLKLAIFINQNSYKYRPKIRSINLGGAPVFIPDAKLLVEAFPSTKIEIVYGSTEAEPISSVCANDLIKCSEAKGLYVGKVNKNVNLRIISDISKGSDIDSEEELDRITLPHNNVGEICVSGIHILKEYYNCPKAQAVNKISLDSGIWHRTGDAGFINSNGELYLMGRLKHSFTHKGSIYYLFPLETKLKENPNIMESTYISKNEELILAVEGKNINDLELKEYLMSNNLPIPDEVIRTKIPRDPRHNSKIDYDKLKTLV